MAELPDLEPIGVDNVTDNDLLLIYDVTNQRAFRVTRASLLKDVPRTGAAAQFNEVEADNGIFTEITAALIQFASAGGIADMVTVTASVTVPTLASQASQAVAVVAEGARADMAAQVSFDGLPAGLIAQAHVSADDTVSITFTNASSGSIIGAARSARVMLYKLPE